MVEPQRSIPKTATLLLSACVGLFAAGFLQPVRPEQCTKKIFPPAPMTAAQEKPVLINTDLISFTVTVTDRQGRHISGLNRTAFTVLDNGVTQEVSFFGDEDLPVSVCIVFDTSASMRRKKIEQAREALTRFIQTSHVRDEFFLIAFNSRAELVLEKTRDAEAVAKKLTYAEPDGETALYDAVYLGLEKVEHGAHAKRVLIVISDGEDNHSRYSFRDLRRGLAESNTIVYAVGILGRYPSKAPGSVGRDTLGKLAKVTGGSAFFPNSNEELSEAFDQIALELRHHYSLGYRPKNFVSDGKWHLLKVTVQQPSLFRERLIVRSRRGYYAVASSR